jgi:antitoxin (DNA-binding transcriptional repressor) of toxin-antitoxin stability system
MRTVNVHKAKTHFSRLIDASHAGETILVAKDGKPWARSAIRQGAAAGRCARRAGRRRWPERPMHVGDRKRPPLSPREGWLSDGCQVAGNQVVIARIVNGSSPPSPVG